MIVEIDDEFADQIVSKAIIQSYIWCTEDVKRAKKTPGSYHEDDIAMWEKLISALEEVGRYFTYDFDNAVKKAKKEMKK